MPDDHLQTLCTCSPNQGDCISGSSCTRELSEVPRGLHTAAREHHSAPCRASPLSVAGRTLVRARYIICPENPLTVHSIVSQTLLVMGATLSPSLSGLLPQPHQINAIIGEVVGEMQRYSHLAPSLRLAANIISDAEERRRQNLRSPSMQYLKMG